VATISPLPRRPIGDGCNGPAPTYAHAVEAFLISHDRAGAWSAGTAVKYRQSLTILGSRLAEGPTGASVAALDTPAGAAALEAAFTAAFATLAPATRARHLAALRSALGWWRARGWLVTDPTAGWARPKIARNHTRALTLEQIAALWRLDIGLREKTLWRLLYETAARATEILTLDVADLDRPGKRARVISKGGDTDWVYYQTGTALLLPRLLAGRTRGPVFLAERAPTRAVPTLDLCPDTGRARLSYRRAAELFEHATPQPPTPPPDDDPAARNPPSGRANRPAPLASPNLSRSPHSWNPPSTTSSASEWSKSSRCAGHPAAPTCCCRSAPVSSTTNSPTTSTAGTPSSPTPPTDKRRPRALPQFVPLSLHDGIQSERVAPLVQLAHMPPVARPVRHGYCPLLPRACHGRLGSERRQLPARALRVSRLATRLAAVAQSATRPCHSPAWTCATVRSPA